MQLWNGSSFSRARGKRCLRRMIPPLHALLFSAWSADIAAVL
jgi:hypothetical protein